MEKNRLNRLRQEIDRLDTKIAILIGKRFLIAGEIGEIKKSQNLDIEDKKREQFVLSKVKKEMKGARQKKAISNIYQEIIKETKFLEK